MRIVVARCIVDYQGKLSAHLPEARRLLMMKADGSVLVHADSLGLLMLGRVSSSKCGEPAQDLRRCCRGR